MVLNEMNREKIVINIIGDSGDGIQLIGSQLSETGVSQHLDVNSLPTFPAEIRAPAGTVAGISSFQLQFSENKAFTAGDQIDVLFAMNPAALKKGLETVSVATLIIVNQDSFTKFELSKAGYSNNPLETEELSAYSLIQVPLTTLTKQSVKDLNLTTSQVNKSKNMFALGILSWLFSFALTTLEHWISKKFNKDQIVLEANIMALKRGYHFAEISELFHERYFLKSSQQMTQKFCQISGNDAFAFACLIAATQSMKPFLLAGYPITPASSLLHAVSNYANSALQVFQAEDEMAALGAVVGASYGGSLAMAVTSGPGFDLKTEFLGLAVMTELPLVVVNIQRAGPSTGMPTKPEQSDLLAAVYGRHGECPLPVLAPSSPSDCYATLIGAFQIATQYMTPVVVLSDAHLASATERWEIPAYDEVKIMTELACDPATFQPYLRDPNTLGRVRAIPGVEGFEHRIGGLEKEMISGQVSYDGKNHEVMTHIRQEKVNLIARNKNEYSFPLLDFHPGVGNDILVISWGSTFGTIFSAISQLQNENQSVSHLHLRLIYPFPNQLDFIIGLYNKVIVPELNSGQLTKLLREKYLINVIPLNKLTGQQFRIDEVYQFIKSNILNLPGSLSQAL